MRCYGKYFYKPFLCSLHDCYYAKLALSSLNRSLSYAKIVQGERNEKENAIFLFDHLKDT